MWYMHSFIPGTQLRSLTMRKLWIMYQVQVQDRWDHTTYIMAAIYNAQGPKEPKHPFGFHPYRNPPTRNVGRDKSSKQLLFNAAMRS